jgi:hypothetical protein
VLLINFCFLNKVIIMMVCLESKKETVAELSANKDA